MASDSLALFARALTMGGRHADIRQEVLAQGLVRDISGATVWRWLSQTTFDLGVIEGVFWGSCDPVDPRPLLGFLAMQDTLLKRTPQFRPGDHEL